MKLNVFTRNHLLLTAFTMFGAGSASAQVTVFGNGFETDNAGWDALAAPNQPLRVASGTNGLTSASGGFHATVGSAATRWGAYRSVFPQQGYTTSIDIYLDVDAGAANDTRFDFSSAINTPAGSHRRDFVFNAGFYNDSDSTGSGNRFVFSGSNGAGRSSAYPKNPARSPVAVTSSGWYTLEHVFSDNGGGILQVELKLKSGASVLGSWVLSDPTDVIGSTVGGNRYGWFASNEFSSLAIDNSSIQMDVPPPVHNETDNLYFETLTAALAAATTGTGDVIRLAAGTYTEPALTINKAVVIEGPNAGISGTGTRGAEARLSDMPLNITAAATLDGIEIHQTGNASDAVLLQAGATVTHSVIRREGITTGNFCRGITTAVGVTGVNISGNLFTGDLSGGLFGGHKTWQSGIYSNGGSAVISGNTFEHCRAALNLDDFNAGIEVSGNTFSVCGTYLSFGGVSPTTGSYAITGNDFGFDYGQPPAANPTLFNNSNVAAGFRIDATGNTFGGVATGDLTDAQKFALEPRMFHRGRSGRNGVIDYVAGEQIVMPGTTIANAIAAADAGDVVRVGPAAFIEDVVLNKAVTLQGAGAGTSTISGATGGGGATVQVAASNATVAGFTITREGNNPAEWELGTLNFGGVTIQGLALSGVTIRDNEITGNRTAIDINHSGGHTVRNNVIHNNHTGLIFRNQTDNLTVTENAITGNRTVGILFLDASGGSNTPLQQAVGSVFSNNNISGNWYGQVVDRQAGGSLPAPGTLVKDFSNNWFGTASPLVVTANSAEPGYAALLPTVFGGSASAPGGQPDIAGAGSANIGFSPLLASGTDTDVETTPGRGTHGFQGDLADTVEGLLGETTIDDYETYEELFIPGGSTVTVTPGGTLAADTLDLGTGATLFVNEGELVIGDGSKISGTFTIFNSFGSWEIGGDTTFEIGRSLALISDIHVAPGVTLTVNGGGELILDGCVIDSQTPGSPYAIEVEDDGLLTIARSVVSDAQINIGTLGSSVPANHVSKVYDSRFTASDIEAGPASRVYHNLFDATTAAASNTAATTAFDPVDGWSNVTDASQLQNPFTLEFGSPADPSRTLEDGNLYVQSGDAVALELRIGSLAGHTVTAAEALLGYNSNRMILTGGSPAVTPGAGWEVLIDDDTVDAPLGLVNSTLSLELDPGDDGVSGPATIGTVNFSAGTAGATIGFFRVQTDGAYNPDGSFVRDTRLTKSSGGVPSFLTAFTANTGELVVDNDAPAISEPSATGTQVQPSVGAVNILQPSSEFVIRGGSPVVLTFTATDSGLAGLDAADAANDLALTADNGAGTVLDADDYTVSAVEALGVVTYTVTLDVPLTAGNGSYAVTATVLDRSGNESALASLGSFEVANEMLATVELQGFVGTGPGSLRDVTFVATGGTSTKTWTKSVAFTASIGTVLLEEVPDGTTAISAKTGWTLRNKLASALTSAGTGVVAFTGVERLKGGDFNGDNVVNTLDYSILRFHWLSSAPAAAVADVTGDGSVTSADYNVLVPNFYTAGDPQ